MSTNKKLLKSHYLHEDLIISILLKLPVKSLIRFKCVSKSWHNLIESSSFIDIYTDYTIKDNRNHLANCVFYSSLSSDFISFISYDTFKVSSNLSAEIPDFMGKCVSLRGSCNGLLYVQTDTKGDYVMNPATRECKEIAKAPKLPCRVESFSYGFGFDPKTKDYKVVRVTLQRPGVANKADVFSLRNNSWKLTIDSGLEGIEFFDRWSRAVVNNVVHWSGYLKREVGYKPVGIAGFDLVDEVFGDIIRIPASLKYRESCYCIHRCCVVKDCLSMAAIFVDDVTVELWVMKEYGVEGSWTRQYCLSLSHVLERPRRYWIYPFEVGFRGEAVLQEGPRLLILRSSSVEDFNIVFESRNAHFISTLNKNKERLINYRESLVQIHRV